MGTPVHDKKRQLDYLQQRMSLLQEMLARMEVEEDLDKTDIDRIETMMDNTITKIKQFKQDWN
ncbi:hypothetical protein [Salibacterium aidingense]|uniref:hypothetical protein n=1 Tax=Salibacterium aidingense TaxID=384933 RepID=UPI0003F95832|nr:hypothetical protein [Salibacterium aidingense]